MATKTYWNHHGTYQVIVDQLEQLIQSKGNVDNPKLNKALERFRKAANCYYDLFNNGLCNRAEEFRAVFGFGGKWIAKQDFPPCKKLEDAMDDIIIKAALEQGVLVLKLQENPNEKMQGLRASDGRNSQESQQQMA